MHEKRHQSALTVTCGMQVPFQVQVLRLDNGLLVPWLPDSESQCLLREMVASDFQFPGQITSCLITSSTYNNPNIGAREFFHI